MTSTNGLNLNDNIGKIHYFCSNKFFFIATAVGPLKPTDLLLNIFQQARV